MANKSKLDGTMRCIYTDIHTEGKMVELFAMWRWKMAWASSMDYMCSCLLGRHFARLWLVCGDNGVWWRNSVIAASHIMNLLLVGRSSDDNEIRISVLGVFGLHDSWFMLLLFFIFVCSRWYSKWNLELSLEHYSHLLFNFIEMASSLLRALASSQQE